MREDLIALERIGLKYGSDLYSQNADSDTANMLLFELAGWYAKYHRPPTPGFYDQERQEKCCGRCPACGSDSAGLGVRSEPEAWVYWGGHVTI